MKRSSSFTNLCLCAAFTTTRNCSTTPRKGRPRRGVICHPPISQKEVPKVKNVVGLHVGSSYVSWVAVEIEKNEISHMGITGYPENFQRMNLCGLSSFALQSFQMLPKANCFITEEAMKAVSNTAGRHQLLFQASRMQYVAMLVALINFDANATKKPVNRVIFLKRKLAARLFDVLVGTEVVSTTPIVTDILNQNTPPRFLPLKCSDKLKSEYSSRSKMEKEAIGYSLITAVTFSELRIRQNQECLKFVGIPFVETDAAEANENVSSIEE